MGEVAGFTCQLPRWPTRAHSRSRFASFNPPYLPLPHTRVLTQVVSLAGRPDANVGLFKRQIAGLDEALAALRDAVSENLGE